MRHVNWGIGLILIILLFSCGRKENELHIVFDDGTILRNCDSVELNGVVIGMKQRLGLNKNLKAVLSVALDPSHKIPADSRFEVVQKNLFSTHLVIHPGKSIHSLHNGDTVQGEAPISVDANFSRQRKLLDRVVKAIERYCNEIDSSQTK
jgi:ABC-type transporter Mla subunit MlaD